MNVAEHNRQAWNEESDDDCDWSIPVEPEIIERARTGDFSIILTDLIGGQLRCGFVITDLYEDHWEDAAMLLNVYSPTSIATRAIKA